MFYSWGLYSSFLESKRTYCAFDISAVRHQCYLEGDVNLQFTKKQELISPNEGMWLLPVIE